MPTTTTTTMGGGEVVGGLVSAVERMRHDHVDGGAVELESHGGGGGTAVASYASFGRTTIPRRAGRRCDVELRY
jgi:hypothetical protein